MRPENWPILLQEHIETSRNEKFQWSILDCAVFSLSWVDKIHGTDIVSSWRNKYSSWKEGKRFFNSIGYKTMETLLDEIIEPSIEVSFARRGDITLAYDRHSIGICLGSKVATFSESGFVIYPKSLYIKGWRV